MTDPLAPQGFGDGRSGGRPWTGLKPPACPQCGVAITREQHLFPGHCGASACIAAHGRKVAAAARKERLQLDIVTERLYARARLDAAESGALETLALRYKRPPRKVGVAGVPHQNEPIVPLDPEQVAEFLAYIDRLVDEAFALPVPEVPEQITDPREENPFVTAMCSACQGGCCARGGGYKAFVTIRTIRFHRAALPGITAEEIRALYRDHLPEAHTKGACLYQTVEGCALPRARRARICNAFRCHSVDRAVAEYGVLPEVPVAIVAIDDDNVTVRKRGTWRPEEGVGVTDLIDDPLPEGAWRMGGDATAAEG